MGRVSIETLRRGDFQEAAKAAARAMAPTPMPMAVFQGHERSERGMQATLELVFEHWPGHIFVAKKDNRVVGVMRMVEWPQCQMSFGQALRFLPTMLFTLGGGVIRGLKWRSIWAKHDPREPHWHLDPVAVVPEIQGRGIGTQLLKRFCTLVDEARKPAYLETDKPENVRLYERFGFSVVGEALALGVRSYFMWRSSP